MTDSENFLTNINNSLFFREFTYSKNEFYPEGGETKELADNVVWLDDLLLIYQVKGRNKNSVGNEETELKWFEKTVKTDAKNQIRDTLRYFREYHTLPVTNGRGRTVDLSAAKENEFLKIVIYEPNSSLIEQQRFVKFIESTSAGLVHLFHIEDYANLCKHLATPAELAEYLYFREELYEKHKDTLNELPEQYVLGHFFTTPNTDFIELPFIENIGKLKSDPADFDFSWVLNGFLERLVLFENGKKTDYYHIIKEIAKLRRQELAEFKKRFDATIKQVQTNHANLPFRFCLPRTGCGYVFVTLTTAQSRYWQNALFNTLETYRYKHKLQKCIGVVIYKDGEYFQMNWGYQDAEWTYNADLEKAVKDEAEFYSKSSVKPLERYNLEP
jgi:hypothetical protein